MFALASAGLLSTAFLLRQLPAFDHERDYSVLATLGDGVELLLEVFGEGTLQSSLPSHSCGSVVPVIGECAMMLTRTRCISAEDFAPQLRQRLSVPFAGALQAVGWRAQPHGQHLDGLLRALCVKHVAATDAVRMPSWEASVRLGPDLGAAPCGVGCVATASHAVRTRSIVFGW